MNYIEKQVSMAGAAWRAHERDVHVAQLGVWEGGRTYYLEFSDQNILTFKNVLVRQKASTKEKTGTKIKKNLEQIF